MLHTSLNKEFHLAALQYLITMAEPACSDPSLILTCFNIFTSCVNVVNGTLVMVQGTERLAAKSATLFVHTFRYLFSTDPTSSTLADLRRGYRRAFSSVWVDFMDLPFRYTMVAAHILVNQDCTPPAWWRWRNYIRPSDQEHVQLAWCITEAVRMGHQQTQPDVSNWTLRFAFYSLSLGPSPPPSVVSDCLKIIAVELGCELSNITTPDERCVQL